MMIDNPGTVMELMEKLAAALPFPVRLTSEIQASIGRAGAANPISSNGSVIGVHYMGDEGGIVCKLDLGPSGTAEALVSITHLRFDARLPSLEPLPPTRSTGSSGFAVSHLNLALKFRISRKREGRLF